MAYVESITITWVIDAKEDRGVMTGDTPNSFIQANMPNIKQGEYRVMIKITGVLYVGPIGSRSIWAMCSIWKWKENPICGSAKGNIWAITSSSIMV